MGQSKQHRDKRCAHGGEARAKQIGSEDRLSMSGCERMHRAKCNSEWKHSEERRPISSIGKADKISAYGFMDSTLQTD